MIREKIDKFIKEIPALPENVRQSAKYLENDDLVKAAESALKDPAFSYYLIELVNKPIFGFRNKIRDLNQVFSILGVEKALQIVTAYYAKLITPERWKVFNMKKSEFQLFQSSLIYHWNTILESKNYKNLHITSIVSLIPASFVVCEKVFEDNIDDVRLLKEQKDLSYDEILYKLSGLRIFDIFIIICKKWELGEDAIRFLKYLNERKEDNSEISVLAKYLHLLMFYELSKPVYIEAGLNDFIEFDISFIEDIYEDFLNIIEGK